MCVASATEAATTKVRNCELRFKLPRPVEAATAEAAGEQVEVEATAAEADSAAAKSEGQGADAEDEGGEAEATACRGSRAPSLT